MKISKMILAASHLIGMRAEPSEFVGPDRATRADIYRDVDLRPRGKTRFGKHTLPTQPSKPRAKAKVARKARKVTKRNRK